MKPPVPADPPPRTRLLGPGLPLALPAPGVVPVTGERSQLIVGKGILQVAVVGVVEHGFDSLPVQGTRNKANETRQGKRTGNRAESGNYHLISARSPVAGSQEVRMGSRDGGNREGTKSGLPIPQLWKGREPDPPALHL